MDIEKINSELAAKTAEEILAWALKTYPGRVALASSFGAEDVVLIDMLAKLDKRARVFTLDTGRLNEETYDAADRVRAKYGLTVETFFPDAARVEALERAKGYYSFRESIENRIECCGIRKVEPLARALKGLSAWITGLRREQSVTRTDVRIVEPDQAHPGLVKINPLAAWSQQQVWDYIKSHQVPYNRLHDAGYPSIGCAPCTRAVKPGEGIRAGRWWWENPEHKECGLHRK